MYRLLVSLLAVSVLCTAAYPAEAGPYDGVLTCPPTAQAGSSTTIVSPADGAIVSQTVVLAVSEPTDEASSVTVCARYLDSSGTSQYVPVATLANPSVPPGPGPWSSLWDVSALPSQSGVALTFYAAYPNNDPVPALIGQRTITIEHVAPSEPPSSTLTIEGPRQYTSPAGVTYVSGFTPLAIAASASAPGGGVTVYDQIDGGTAATYTEPILLGGLADGPHTITYWASDSAGNVEPSQTLGVVLDTQPPSITPLVTGSFAADGSAYGPVTVGFAAGDSGSGLHGIYFTLDPNLESQTYTPGQQIVVTATTELGYLAIDNVGNTTAGTLAITVAAPTPTAAAVFLPTATPSASATPPGPFPTATPRPTPTWPPLDGPPILNRTATAGLANPALGGAASVHVHVMPPFPAHSGAAKPAHKKPRRTSGAANT
jgi:hypothetical protein